jgi:hypothetical protein
MNDNLTEPYSGENLRILQANRAALVKEQESARRRTTRKSILGEIKRLDVLIAKSEGKPPKRTIKDKILGFFGLK